MPLFRCNNKLYFFAHIPKCGGYSVEAYLAKRFGTLAFLDNKYLRVPQKHRWSATSPQHIEIEALSKLFPRDWIAASFAVVRNPFARLVSAWNFRVMSRKGHEIPPSFEAWLDQLAEDKVVACHESDNHLAHQIDLIPQGAEVFRLENGMAPIVSWLDQLEEATSSPREIEKSGAQGEPLKGFSKTYLTQDAVDKIREIYKEDFSMLGYSVQPPASKMWLYSPTGGVRMIRTQRKKHGILNKLLPKH